MGIQKVQCWLLLIGLLGLTDKIQSTRGFTSLDYTLDQAINHPKALVRTRKAATKTLKEGNPSPPSWKKMMEIGQKIVGNYPKMPKDKIYDDNQALEIKKDLEKKLYNNIYRIERRTKIGLKTQLPSP
ncbi:hypothetical protein PCASD_13802 [Puccinia coronata f. sp. avenae]|uniref:Uncharacterized protein n=1 Tax=Puccinia coronata f. sp. avenae TaxID=200324 RepID=A0A2N5UE46_9BASI|nr:hypothetical protein PCASD_23269 [Puccinia coronata f. sp. avenae]PLW35998.1 hypothetical protein PCASD_13802 [Puccinia coronata f. sp. avenae]